MEGMEELVQELGKLDKCLFLGKLKREGRLDTLVVLPVILEYTYLLVLWEYLI